jgi:two-component system osmolarity sensor histidine kinase EnvZ
LLWVVGSSVLLMMISVLFMRNQVRPIRRLAVASERFGKGQEILGFKPQGAIEVRRAGESFMLMRKRIQRQLSQRTEMLAGISHDLRTPLTRLKLQLAMMDDADGDIYAMKSDINDMETMIEGYIDFVRGEGDETPREIQIADLIEKVSNKALRSFDKANIYADLHENLPVMMVKENAFGRCLSNIIENGLRYGKNLWIKAYVVDYKLELRIEDDGEGVPEDKFDDVFKPFFRVDTSRSSETGGVGLGMSVAMDIVHGHGGKIWLEKSEAHGGLKVCIQLPL